MATHPDDITREYPVDDERPQTEGSNSSAFMALEALETVHRFFLLKDTSRRRTVYQLCEKEGSMLMSTVESNPCCFGSCTWTEKHVRFLYDSFGPVMQMVEKHECCSTNRMMEVNAPPSTYLGSVVNATSCWSFGFTVIDHEENPRYYIGLDRSRAWWCCSNSFRIMCSWRRRQIGSIFRRKNWGNKIGYTFYIPVNLHVTDKALLIAAIFFLDAMAEGDDTELGCCIF
ncbi:Scramblase [Trinorchestia longiramus]|nr:Scramblase [Trinorchestia longiramus]